MLGFHLLIALFAVWCDGFLVLDTLSQIWFRKRSSPTHIRKGNRAKRRSEEDALSGLARTKQEVGFPSLDCIFAVWCGGFIALDTL